MFLMALAVVLAGLPALLQGAEVQQTDVGDPWVRHTIDASSRGADGVRLADVNGDGHPDIATPWEEGGVVRAYLNPGPEHVAGSWPALMRISHIRRVIASEAKQSPRPAGIASLRSQ